MNDRILGMVGLAIRARKASSGVFLTEKALDEGTCELVIMSEDIGQSNKRKIESKCTQWDVPIIYHGDKESLSHAAGKKDMPVVGILDHGFAEAIAKLKNNGGADK